MTTERHSQNGMTASDWVVRTQMDKLAPNERREFEEWLGLDARNRREFLKALQVWGLAHQLKNRPEVAEYLDAKVITLPAARMKTHQAWSVAAAAVFAILAVTAWLFLRASDETYRTAKGEQVAVKLADGSTVHLNTETALTTRFTKGKRETYLKYGEAFFDVAHDSTRPFEVVTPWRTVRALGTQFNLRILDSTLTVTVIEGKVAVKESTPEAIAERKGDRKDRAPVMQEEMIARPVAITAGEQVSYSTKVASTEPLVEKHAVAVREATAWVGGRLYFEDKEVAQILREVSRYTDVQFVVGDGSINSLRLSGVFNIGDADSVAFVLKTVHGLRVERAGNTIRLYQNIPGHLPMK